MAWIGIEQMEFYAYHGHFDEEQTIGNRFVLDFFFKAATRKAQQSDMLADTVDYSKVYLVIKEEMEKKSKLVENIAARIVERVHREFPGIQKMKLKIQKINPPIGNKVKSVSFELRRDFIRKKDKR